MTVFTYTHTYVLHCPAVTLYSNGKIITVYYLQLILLYYLFSFNLRVAYYTDFYNTLYNV